jgi:tetratricopeptide (TPR) repeat protein
MKFLLNVLLFVLLLGLPFGPASAEPSTDGNNYFAAYHEGNYELARRLAAREPDNPASQLVLGLCDIHDTKTTDISSGLKTLKALWDDAEAPDEIREEAGLSFARAAQLLLARNKLSGYDSADVAIVYEALMQQSTGIRACYAAQYLGELALNESLRSGAMEGLKKTMARLEVFPENYEGDKSHLAALHLSISTIYNDILKDYQSAYRHMEKAYQAGITFAPVHRSSLYGLARHCHLNLNRPEEARAWYEEVIATYPFSREASLSKKFLNKLVVAP